MAEIAHSTALAPGWLRDRDFDLWFCGGLAGLALAAGLAMSLRPELYPLIVLLDFWLLGYQHVAATFTRLCFDRDNFARYRFLVLRLPFIVLAATMLVAVGIGGWAVATIYFYWQWFHTARQSWGIAQIYRRKSGGLVDEDPRLAQLCFYALPVWGILHRSQQHPGTFLTLPVELVPVPAVLADLAGAVALVLISWWGATRILAWSNGRLPVAHTLYMLTHFALFYVGYILIDDVDAGWVVTNIWHTAQYLMIVWLFNSNRFRSGIDAKAPFLSALSQPAAVVRYVAICLGLSTVVYFAIVSVEGLFPATATLIALVAAQTLNFHHFIVDAVIWRARRQEVQASLALAH